MLSGVIHSKKSMYSSVWNSFISCQKRNGKARRTETNVRNLSSANRGTAGGGAERGAGGQDDRPNQRDECALEGEHDCVDWGGQEDTGTLSDALCGLYIIILLWSS